LVRVTLNEPVLSTFTVPKFKPDGLASRREVRARPLPLRGIASGEFGASLTSETKPVMFPGAVGVNTALNVALLPDAITMGVLRPAILKLLPETLTREMMTLLFPVLLSLMVCELVSPMATLPRLALGGVADKRPFTAVPLSPIVKLGSGALLVIAILPVASPAVSGAKWTSRLTLCLAKSFKGVATLLIEKPLPLTLTREIVMLLVPSLLSLTAFESLSPMITLPKLALAGVAARRPSAPSPLNPIVKLRSEALLVIAILPVASPVLWGAKWASRLTLCLACSLKGVATLLMEKPLPLTLTREIVRLLVPVLLSLRIFELLSPMITSPKLALAGVADRRPSAPVPLNPIVTLWSEALLVMAILPVASPAVWGAKWASRLTLCLA
jgi:hypothetical protein